MRYLALFAVLSGLIWSQPKPQEQTQKISVPAGSRSGTLTFQLATPPEKEDEFQVFVPDSAITTALILPNGRRLDAESAEAAGIDWRQIPTMGPLGSPDAYVLGVLFKRSAAKGPYQFRFDATKAVANATIEGRFASSRVTFNGGVATTVGFKQTNPAEVSLSRGAVSVTLAAVAAMEVGVVDVLVGDPSANVSVKLPDGRLLVSGEVKEKDIESKAFDNRSEYDSGSGMPMSFGGVLLPGEGRHHTFTFGSLPPGKYEVIVRSRLQSTTRFTAALIPVGAFLNSLTERVAKPQELPPGGVFAHLVEPPPYRAHTGEPITLKVGFEGEPVADPVSFGVKLEYSEASGPETGGPPVRSARVVKVSPKVERRDGGIYALTVVPEYAGLLRVQFSATGTTKAGKPFKEEGILENSIHVSKAVAVLRSLKERARMRPGSDKVEGLDILAELEVFEAGRHEVTAEIADSSVNRNRSEVHTTMDLAVGAQTIVLAFPAKRLRKEVQDGPYQLLKLWLFRENDNTDQDFVTDEVKFQTAPYKRDQWYRGEWFGDESAQARGIMPAPSGRFRMVEVEWGATVTGGNCYWLAGLSGRNMLGNGELAKGRHIFRFVFDGRSVSAGKSGKLHFSPNVNCKGTENTAEEGYPYIAVELDSAEFEPAGEIDIYFQELPTVAPGQTSQSSFRATGVTLSEPISFSVSNLAGIRVSEPKFSGATQYGREYGVALTVEPNAAPGRYFVPIEAKSGTKSGSSFLVIDVRQAAP